MTASLLKDLGIRSPYLDNLIFLWLSLLRRCLPYYEIRDIQVVHKSSHILHQSKLDKKITQESEM